jgi:hypothetical protein
MRKANREYASDMICRPSVGSSNGQGLGKPFISPDQGLGSAFIRWPSVLHVANDDMTAFGIALTEQLNPSIGKPAVPLKPILIDVINTKTAVAIGRAAEILGRL